MALAKKLVWLIVLLLFLEVIQRVVDKIGFAGSFFISSIAGSIQLLAILFFLFYCICIRIFPRRKRKGWIVLSFFILVALLEGLFAWLIYHADSIPTFMTKAFQYYYNYYEVDKGSFHKRLSVYNPRLLYTLRPGVKGIFQTNEFTTTISANSKGLRDDDSSLKWPAIICLGDSYTMGWGVEQTESFPQLLGQLSRQNVLNTGIASYGTAREMILLKELDTSALTHLVIQYCSNDYHENNAYILNNYNLAITSRAAYDSVLNRSRMATSYFPGKYFLITTKVFFKLQWNELMTWVGMADTKPQKQNEKEHARIFIDVLSHSPINFSKVKVIVCALGDYREFGPEFLQQVMKQASERHDIFKGNLAVLDLSRSLEEKDWFRLDAHLKPSGHQKMAEKLWESIRQP